MKKIAILISTLFLFSLPLTFVLADNTEETNETTSTSSTIVSTDKKTEAQDIDFLNAKKFNLTILLANDFITQAQYNDAIIQLESAITNDQMEAVITNLIGTNTDASHYLNSFIETYLNVKSGIDTLKKDHLITAEQANEFFKRTDAARTKEELLTINKELETFIQPVTRPTDSSTTVETTQTKETNSTHSSTTTPTISSDKKEVVAKKLPQTGDRKNRILPIVGGIVILIIIFILYKKRKNNTDVEDIE